MSASQDPGSSSSPNSDLYAALNVSIDATPEELKSSFRKLSQQFHPDKHVEEHAKAAATDHFTKVKEAYELLSDAKFRRIYNEFGLEAARSAAMPGMELLPYSDLAERFRNENPGAGAQGGTNGSRDAYFTVTNSFEPRVDATGLVVALEDGVIADPDSLAICTQVAFSSMATAYVSQKNTIGARYGTSIRGPRYGSGNPSGIGEVALSFRRQIDPYMHAEGTAYIPLDEAQNVSYGFKAFRSLSANMTGSLESSYDPLRKDLTTALTYARSFDERRTASVSWAYGASGGFAFTWRRNAFDEFDSDSKKESDKEEDIFRTEENTCGNEEPGWRVKWAAKRLQYLLEPMGWRWTLRWSIMHASLSFVIRRPIGQAAPLWEKCEPMGPDGASVKLRTQVGLTGWGVEVGGGRKFVISDTAWSTSVSFGTIGVVWRLKLSRSGHQFTLPVVLYSGAADPKVATIAALTTSVLVSAFQILIVTPWQRRKDQEEREEAKSRRVDVLEQARAEAETAVSFMQLSVERCREREEGVEIEGRKGCGLLIQKAVYGISEVVKNMRFSDDPVTGREIELEVAEVTQSVQALVENSAVQIVSSTKSTLMGFWDPTAYGDKEDIMLRIWYLFKGEKHDCVLRDDEPIELPISSHQVSSW